MKVAEIYKLIDVCQGVFNFYKRMAIIDELPEGYRDMDQAQVMPYVNDCKLKVKEYRKKRRYSANKTKNRDWTLPKSIRPHTVDELRGM
jgi:hypothetical protein